MANLGYVSTFNINGSELTLKDAELTEIVNEIIEAIGANNNNIAERINNLHDRSFDAEIKISSQAETEISNIVDGLYKLQYVTITGEGTEATETLNNSAILIQQGTNQYLIKDGQISNRTKTNNEWSSWESNNVKPDWNAISGSAAEILNKPDLSNFLTIETQPNWNETNTSSAAYIQNKPTIPDDSNLVHKTGNETIFQTKTFAANGEIHLASGWHQIYDDDEEESLQEALDARNNVQADWNQTTTTAKDYIKNKPTIPTTSTTVTQNDTNPVSSGAVYAKFADLIGSAPAALDTLQEIATALNNDADLAGTLTTQISSKVPKVSNPTTDNFASFNSDGTIKDSGHSHSDYITSIKTVNNESLVGTGNIVVSGLPQVSASDNGKILMVVNGQWQLVSPSVLYTGQGVPNNSQGNNGDLYMQTD